MKKLIDKLVPPTFSRFETEGTKTFGIRTITVPESDPTDYRKTITKTIEKRTLVKDTAYKPEKMTKQQLRDSGDLAFARVCTATAWVFGLGTAWCIGMLIAEVV